MEKQPRPRAAALLGAALLASAAARGDEAEEAEPVRFDERSLKDGPNAYDPEVFYLGEVVITGRRIAGIEASTRTR